MIASFSRYLHVRCAHAPSWHVSGECLAFLTDITGFPQVWRVNCNGGWPDQITFSPDRVLFGEYSPVDGRLIFGQDAGGNERVQFYLLHENGAEVPLTDAPEAFHVWGDWSPDGNTIGYSSNARDPRYFDVYLMDLVSREARRVWTTDGTAWALRFSPDGECLVISLANTNLDNDLYLLDLRTDERHHLTPHTGEAAYSHVHFTPDGRALYLVSNQDREFGAVMRLDLRTGTWDVHDAREWDVSALALSRDGHWLAYAYNVDGSSDLVVENLPTGNRLSVTGLPPGAIEELAFSPCGRYLALTHFGPRHTADIWLLNLETGQCTPLTHSSLAGLSREAFVEPQAVRYRSFDGLEIPALLYLPRANSNGGKPPVIVYVHGGPESQYRNIFQPVIQYLVAHGYAVFAPNVRGSTGYGKSYTHLDDVEKRPDAVADLKWGVLWLRESGLVDGERVAIMGRSYGGYMVLAALTTYPEIWTAGVDIVGIANFVTFLENTAPWRRHLREAEYGSLERHREVLERLSPIHRVDRIRVPLMVIHGVNDPRVPVGEADQIVAALRKRGVPVEYLRYEDEGHGPVKLHNRLDAYPKVVAFLNKYMANVSPEAVHEAERQT